MAALHTCDLCNSFSTKNIYLFKRHKQRCRKSHGISRKKKPSMTTTGQMDMSDVTLDEKDASSSEMSKTAAGVSQSEATSGETAKAKGETKKTKPQRKIIYTCNDCSFVTKGSRNFLYHQVEVHQAKINIYACTECQYCSKHRTKMVRHMTDTHRIVDFDYEHMEPEYNGMTQKVGTTHSQEVSKSDKGKAVVPPLKIKTSVKQSVVSSKHSSSHKKLTVKFGRSPAEVKSAFPAPTAKAASVSPTASVVTQQNDHLSRVVEEIKDEMGHIIFKCKECQFTSDDKQQVAKHAVSWHVDTKSFSCSYCDYITFERNDLLTHNITHRNEHQFKCDECTYSTDFRPNYDRHVQNHKGSFPYKCDKCTYGSNSDAAIKRHMTSNHDVTPPKKKHLPAPKPMQSHSETGSMQSKPSLSMTHSKRSPSKSQTSVNPGLASDPLYQMKANLFMDSSSASMVPRPTLPPPTLESSSLLYGGDSRELSPVRKLPPNITQYVEKFNGKLVCPICKLKYKRSSDLNRHMKRKHGCKLREYLENIDEDDPFMSEGTSNTADYAMGEDHLSDAEGDEMDEDDDDDDLELMAKLDQRADMEDGSESPPKLECKFCNYKAKWSSDLKRHYQSHSIEKRFKCNFCSKKYKFRSDLNVHVRKDHNKEPTDDVKVVKVAKVPKKRMGPALFKCPCCAYTSPWKSDIDRHSRLHGTEKTFQCLHCEYQTYWRGDIRRHVYKKHHEIMTEGVALNDVINIRKDLYPKVIGDPNTPDGQASALSSDAESLSMSSRETTPVRMDQSHEGSPEINLSRYVTQTQGGHSPTPSPIKELGGGIFKCQYCGFEANAPSKMDQHIATHTNLKRYMCPLCGRRANWKWDIAKHIRKDHSDETTQVIKLSKQEAEATIQSYIEEHPVVRRDHHLNLIPEVHTEPDSVSGQFFKCTLCDFSADTRISVSHHLRSMHLGQGGGIVLIKGDKMSRDQSSVAKASKNLEQSFSTPVTSAGNSSEVDLPFMCSECKKRGHSKGDIKKHYHYAHPDKEIRIVYLGDGSQSVYTAKTELTPDKSVSSVVLKNAGVGTDITPTLASTSPAKHPKVLGYIKPFVCGQCGRRSNWRWDVRRHIRERHPGIKNVQVFELTEEQARASYVEYMNTRLPELNRVSNSIPKKRRKNTSNQSSNSDSESSAFDTTLSDSSFVAPTTPTPMHTLAQAALSQPVFPNQQPVFPQMESSQGNHPQPMTVQHFVSSPNHAPSHAARSLPIGRQYKQYKCSACIYRSNYRGDVQRHLNRRHGPMRAKVIVLDKETARATLESYAYDKNMKNEDLERQEALRGDSGVVLPKSTTASGPLPPEAWAGLEKKLWKCSMCSYSNEDKVDVLKHLSKHNMKAYKCTSCNWTSNFKSGVQRHMQVKHPGDETAQCRLSIKLIKEGPGIDQTGRSIMPGGLSSEPGIEAPVAVTSQESMHNPKSTVSTAIFYCKLCNVNSNWRSCICRHLKKTHKTTDYCGNITKKIIRTKSSGMFEVSSPSPMPLSSANRSARSSEGSNRPKNFICKICPYRTYKRKMLKFHLTCHKPQPGVKQVRCKYCPYYVSSNRLLSQHLHLHLQDFKQVQETSYPVTPTKSYESSPAGSSKGPQTPKRHKCEKCPYTTNSKNDFLYHKQFHRPKPTADYKCDYCDYWVSHRRLIKQHMKVHEEAEGYESETPTPAKSEYSESSLVYDTVEIAAIKQRIISSKITHNISSSPLVSPMKLASGCSVGGKRGFLRKDGGYRKIHQCRHCPYMNIRLRNMRLHEMMHGRRTASHPLMKCIHCDYYVGSKGLLAHHMKVHQPDYGIDFMEHGAAKNRSDSLDSEESEMDSSISLEKKVDSLLEITRFKKYGCEKCPYATSKRSRFQKHVELHGSKQKCKCDFCDYSVPTSNLLNQHTRLHFEPNQNLLAAQSILNLQYLPEMPADVALASMMSNNDAKNPVSITHDHVDLYENHNEDLEPKKLYRCDKCPYANVRRDHLLAHLRCHMTKNEYACPYCDYSVSKTHVLVQHVKVHFSPLPELSEWLTENGNTERMKEVKNPDIDEAIAVVNLFHTDKKMKKEAEGKAAENTSEEKTGTKEDTVKTEDTDKVKETETEADNDKATTSTRSRASSDKNQAGIDGLEKIEEKPNTKKKDEPSEEANNLLDNGNKSKDDVKKGEQTCGPVVEDGEVPSTSGGPHAGNQANDENNGVTASQTDGKQEEDLFVCQYCDREFPTSDSLVGHEVKHLVGNNYEEFVAQLLQGAENIDCNRSASTEDNKSNLKHSGKTASCENGKSNDDVKQEVNEGDHEPMEVD